LSRKSAIGNQKSAILIAVPPPTKIPFDSLTLAAVVAEAQAYVGGKLQKVWQPDDNTIVLALYRDGREGLFMISCHPIFARAYFVTKKPTNLQPMPGLCTSLRAHVDGGRIAAIRQINFDRILAIDVETHEGPHTLVAELMGKHSNLMLLDPETRVIAAAKWVNRSKSVRPIQAARTYEPPPFEAKRSLLEAKPGENLNDFQGVSPFLRRLLETRGSEGLTELQATIQAQDFHPVLVPGVGAYPIPLEDIGLPGVSRQTISIALEQHFDSAIRNEEIRSLKESLLGQLKRVLLAREVALNELNQAAETARRAGHFQLMGELILAYGSNLESGASSLQAQDYEGESITISLDPELGYLDNANKYFSKAKHAKAREGTVKDQIGRMTQDHVAISGMIAKAELEERLDRLRDLREDAKKHRWLHDTAVTAKKKDERPYEGHRVRELLGPNGYTVLYGENAEANDHLLVRVARPNDYWLHVRGSASAHAVIQTQNHPEKVSKEVLMFAAKIVVQHSPSKHSGYVPVDYTLKKYVRKPKGAAKGMAVYTHEKTLHVEGH
jgi:predicted ribosome quality control (RQC) complex YloA/Tae2 family protein